METTTWSEAPGTDGPGGRSATMRAGTRVNAGQAPQTVTREPTHRVFVEDRRWIGKQATRAPIHTRRDGGASTHAGWETWKHGKPCRWRAHARPVAREGRTGPAGWRTGRWYRGRRVTPVEGGGRLRVGMERRQGMTTGKGLEGSERVRKLRNILHAKARQELDRRFHALAARMWRMDFLTEARLRSAATAGPPGWRGRHSDTPGRQMWSGGPGNCRKTRGGHLQTQGDPAGAYPEEVARPAPAVGNALHPGSGVADIGPACAGPISGAGPQPEQYAHRPERSATDAVKRIHRLVNTGHREVVDGDLSNHFGEIPHAGPMKSVARRVSDGRMPGLVKAWLEMPTEEDNGEGGKRGVNRAPEGSGKARRRARRSRPAGQPCMRRFIPGWKVLGYARRFSSGIVNYADDFRLPGKAPAAVRRIMERPGRRSTRGKPDACGVPKRPRVSGIPRGTQPSPGRRSLHRHPTGQGERQGHPPQGQRANRRKTPRDDTRGHGGAPDRMLSG